MKFTDYKYEHMDIEALQEQLKAICSKLQNAASYAEFKNAFIELNDVNKYINTNQTLVDVRHTVDTRDEYYTKENDFLNEMLPVLKEDIVNCNKAHTTVHAVPHTAVPILGAIRCMNPSM